MCIVDCSDVNSIHIHAANPMHFVDRTFRRQNISLTEHFVDRTFRRKIITMFLSFPRRRKGLPTLIFLELLGLCKPANFSIDRIYYILAVPKGNQFPKVIWSLS